VSLRNPHDNPSYIAISTHMPRSSRHTSAQQQMLAAHSTQSCFHSASLRCPAGDKIRFKIPGGSSSSTVHSGALRRLAQEPTTVIPASVLNKFAAEGYVYRGQVDLGTIVQRSGYRTAAK
jgi:hypothetical protein